MELSWVKKLSAQLKGARRIVILGIGNTQKGDDGLGIYSVRLLAKKFNHAHKSMCVTNIKVIIGEGVPENYTGEIRKFKPTHTIIIDACVGGKSPGTIYLVDKDKISNDDVSTHRISLSMLVKFIEETIGSKVVIIGVEPKSLDWGKFLSDTAKKSVSLILKYLIQILQGVGAYCNTPLPNIIQNKLKCQSQNCAQIWATVPHIIMCGTPYKSYSPPRIFSGGR